VVETGGCRLAAARSPPQPKGPVSVMVDMITADNERMEAEIARLKRQLDASRAGAAADYADAGKLRAALRQIAATPKEHKLVTSICEIALAPASRVPCGGLGFPPEWYEAADKARAEREEDIDLALAAEAAEKETNG
jgi:hypothetical protein